VVSAFVRALRLGFQLSTVIGIILSVSAFDHGSNEVIVSRFIHPTENMHGDRPSAASELGLADAKELAAAAFQRTRMPIVLWMPEPPTSRSCSPTKHFLN
jgi:hypothetical protein